MNPSAVRTWLLRPVLRFVVRFEPIRRIVFIYLDRRSARRDPIHPIDHQYQVSTSGSVSGSVLERQGSDRDTRANSGYGGSQPSIIRRAIRTIPDHSQSTFIDLGCGKGRALVVASEFPFRSIIGVEISTEVARVAEQNALVIARQYPDRTPIVVINGDAVNRELPAGDVVIYLYHPFGEHLVKDLLKRVESALSTETRTIRIVYYNPVWGAIFDGSPGLKRVFAETIPYDPSEISYGPDDSDVVVIWQDSGSGPADVPKGASRRILVPDPGTHAELAG
jgi:SAM-dependent methyltransferase